MATRLPLQGVPAQWMRVASVATVMVVGVAAAPIWATYTPARERATAAEVSSSDGTNAAVGLSVADNIPAMAGDTVDVPVTLASNGNGVSSLVFELDYDVSKLTLTLGPDEDGFREVLSATFPNLPTQFVAGAFVTTGLESDVEVFVHVKPNLEPPPDPLPTLPDGTVVELTFTAIGAAGTTTPVTFEQTDPVPSAGLSNGSSNPDGVATDDGSVDIVPATQSVALKTGFNLIGFRVVPTEPDPVDVFAPIYPDFVAAYDYFNCATYRFYKKGIPVHTLPSIDATHGYWVEVTADTTLVVTGTVVTYPVSIPMCQGFNLISYPSRDPVPMPAALNNSIATHWKAAFGEPFPFKFYNVTLPVFTLTHMRTGFGYWVDTNQATTLTVAGP